MQWIKNTHFKTERLKYCMLQIFALVFVLQSCSVSKQITKQAAALLLNDSVVATGHVGISIYEPATNKYWYNYNGDKYFVPASNTKLFSLYAGLKYLGDSLAGIRYQNFNDTAITIFPTGDPTFLHPDFARQPVINFLKAAGKNIYIADNWKEQALGYGWSWDDYNDAYMVERSSLPVHGNIVRFKADEQKATAKYSADIRWNIQPQVFTDSINHYFSLPLKLQAKREIADSAVAAKALEKFNITRDRSSNKFVLEESTKAFAEQEIPFVTNGNRTAISILKKEYGLNIKDGWLADNSLYSATPAHLQIKAVKSRPVDSMFIPMMYNSDNFFAEQTLLMASNEHLGFMNDEAIIDTLLNLDLKEIPQRPSWADGSGLSRYNLFTPQSFVYIINKMKNEFGLDRMKRILPTGGSGTFKNYYVTDSAFIYAKTGSLTGVIALSGILITKKNKLLIFSVLTNNFKGRATLVRRAVEKFIQQIRNKY